MKNFLLLIGTAFFLSACADMPVKDIESFSYRGYCENEAGQDLSASDCNQKVMKDVSADKKSESDTMIKNINKDLEKQNSLR